MLKILKYLTSLFYLCNLLKLLTYVFKYFKSVTLLKTSMKPSFKIIQKTVTTNTRYIL